MTLQVIYTLKEGGQKVANFEFAPEIIETKESFIHYCETALKAHHAFHNDIYKWSEAQINHHTEPPKICKLSACIYGAGAEEMESPKWYDESQGKVYFSENIEA